MENRDAITLPSPNPRDGMIAGMSRRSVRTRLLITSLLAGWTLHGTPHPEVLAQAPRTVAVGDVHGAFEPFVAILQTAGLIDAKRQWTGGAAVLVQTGDVFDRGTGVRDALDLLMRLEDEARRAGGRVDALLGNHEMMNLLHEFRDVNPAVYASFADKRSDDRRRRAYEDYARIIKRRGGRGTLVQSQDEWMRAHPPGFVEYVEALGPRGRYGRWLRSRKVVTTVQGAAFMHAGINPDAPETASFKSLDDVTRVALKDVTAWDDTKAAMVQAQLVPPFCTLDEAIEAAGLEIVRIGEALKANAPPGEHVTRELVEQLQWLLLIGKSSLLDSEGPLWFRGFALLPDAPDNPAAGKIAALVDRFAVKRFVTGHTPSQPGRIRARFGNRIILIDTGMLTTYFKSGRPSALELQGERVTAIYPDAREVLVPSGSAALDHRFFRAASTSAR
jgi:hypothetical protein